MRLVHFLFFKYEINVFIFFIFFFVFIISFVWLLFDANFDGSIRISKDLSCQLVNSSGNSNFDKSLSFDNMKVQRERYFTGSDVDTLSVVNEPCWTMNDSWSKILINRMFMDIIFCELWKFCQKNSSWSAPIYALTTM